jgi:hypothetical protein
LQEKNMKAWVLVFGVCIVIECLRIPFGLAAEDLVTQFEFQNLKQDNEAEKSAGPLATPASEADRLTHEYRMTQEENRLYECGVLSIALVASLLIILRFIVKTPGYSAVHIVNASALVFIIFGTIFLVILADAEAQLTASMGILGAIAGYLFGTMRREGEEKLEKIPKQGATIS